jgi:histidinol-phosphate aminotransferase
MTDHKKHISKSVMNIKPYQPGKTSSEIKRLYDLDKVVKLSSNENPLGPSPKVTKALQSLFEEISRYPEDAAPALKAKLVDYLQVPAEQITFGNGSSEVIDSIIRLFLKPGKNMIVTEHSFFLYRVLANMVSGEVKLVNDNNFEQDTSAILKAIDAKTSLVILANPNNPTGTWIAKEELFNFIRQVPDDVVVVIDEAYYRYMDDTDYASALELIKECPNLIITRTFSKIFALAGMRFGLGIASKEMIGLLERVRKAFNVSSPTLIAALAALEDEEFVAKSLALNKIGMQQLETFFNKLGLQMIATAGNFITVNFGKQAKDIAQKLLTRGVIVRPLVPYGMPNYLRVNTGTKDEIDFFIEQLQIILNN